MACVDSCLRMQRPSTTDCPRNWVNSYKNRKRKRKLNNAVAWMASTRHLLSKSSCPRTNLWWLGQEFQLQMVSLSFSCSTVFQFPSKVQIHILFFAFFQFYTVVSMDCKVHNSNFFFIIIARFGCLVGTRWSVFISKSQRSLKVSSSRTDVGFAYTICSNLNF